ncbi:MAG: hypothetical protein HYV90_03500 [Candidatus Woesebacteria bacterium]|nr:MAG: hypothetical protein HYV90_03500 [Candidatus Woesebacteria bacterium]
MVEKSQLADSPAHNNEAEDIMATIIEKASEANEWVPVLVDDLHPNEGLYDGVHFGREVPETSLTEGLINLKIAGLVTEEKIDGKRVIKVTERFIDYYKKLTQ